MENVTSQLVLAEHFDVSARMSQLISTYLYHFHQGSDKGGGVVQMVLVDTKRNA